MINKSSQQHEVIFQRLQDEQGVTAALKQAAREAIQQHARFGQRIVVWRDGKVVWEDAATRVQGERVQGSGDIT